jgi:hypothetical protein
MREESKTVFRPKRAYLWLSGVALVVGALLLTDQLIWQPWLTADNVRRNRPGMTLAEAVFQKRVRPAELP